jgi:hypothetical protein
MSRTRPRLPTGEFGRYNIEEVMVDLVQKYARHGHPTIEEMMEAQGVAFSGDPACFPGDFRPEAESRRRLSGRSR